MHKSTTKVTDHFIKTILIGSTKNLGLSGITWDWYIPMILVFEEENKTLDAFSFIFSRTMNPILSNVEVMMPKKERKVCSRSITLCYALVPELFKPDLNQCIYFIQFV